MDKVSLKINGRVYSGWTKVQITRALDAMSGDFELSLTWDLENAIDKPINEGDSCVVELGTDRVITGFIDDWIPSYDESEVTIAVSGRDKTGDLVDCSVVGHSQFLNLDLAQIAKEICKPFNITVIVNSPVGELFSRVAIEQGETCHELLTRLAKQRGIMLTSDVYGNLVLTKASTEVLPTALVLGENIKAARGRFSRRDRFSKFIVKATGYGGGSEWDNTAVTAIGGQKAEITDKDITRYRPKIIVNDEISTAEGASKRGQWERQRSIGESNTSEITVTGWRMSQGGKLWETNKLVTVKDSIQGINGNLLIKTIMFSEDDSGRLTVIGVIPREAMDIPVSIEKETKVDAGWSGAVVER